MDGWNIITTMYFNSHSEDKQESINITIQWRIQDSPEEGAPTPQGGR